MDNKIKFIDEVNATQPNINLKDEEVVYVYKATSETFAEVTITYKGKTKIYRIGHGTTSAACQFLIDYKNGFYGS